MKEKIVTMGLCDGVNQDLKLPKNDLKWTSVSLGLREDGRRTVGCFFLDNDRRTCNFAYSDPEDSVNCKHLFPETAVDAAD